MKELKRIIAYWLLKKQIESVRTVASESPDVTAKDAIVLIFGYRR